MGLFQVASIGFKGIKKLFQLPNSYATLWLLITELLGGKKTKTGKLETTIVREVKTD